MQISSLLLFLDDLQHLRVLLISFFCFELTEQYRKHGTQRIQENEMFRNFYQDVRTLLRFFSVDFSEMKKHENEKTDTVNIQHHTTR